MLRIGLLLMTLGVLAMWAGWRVGLPWGVALAWFAVALLVVGVGYGLARPAVFGKRADGRLRIGNQLVLAPYLVYAFIVWNLARWLSREAAWNVLTPNVRIGRRLTRQEVFADVDVVLDLTAEWPATASAKEYVCFPILDAGVRAPKSCIRPSIGCRLTATSTSIALKAMVAQPCSQRAS